jgi:hypothetical protein
MEHSRMFRSWLRNIQIILFLIRYEGPGWEIKWIPPLLRLEKCDLVFWKKAEVIVYHKLGKTVLTHYHEMSDWGVIF